MPAGRPKKPTAVKKAQGTYREDREIENEMMPAKLMFAPSAPPILSTRGKKLWESACAELAELEMLHRTDLELLASYCSEMDNFWDYVAQLQNEGAVITTINKYGEPVITAHPLVNIKNNALRNAMALAAKFGFTPADRTKIQAPPKEREGTFDEMLNYDDE